VNAAFMLLGRVGKELVGLISGKAGQGSTILPGRALPGRPPAPAPQEQAAAAARIIECKNPRYQGCDDTQSRAVPGHKEADANNRTGAGVLAGLA
jgi:hypothetical protein